MLTQQQLAALTLNEYQHIAGVGTALFVLVLIHRPHRPKFLSLSLIIPGICRIRCVQPASICLAIHLADKFANLVVASLTQSNLVVMSI